MKMIRRKSIVPLMPTRPGAYREQAPVLMLEKVIENLLKPLFIRVGLDETITGPELQEAKQSFWAQIDRIEMIKTYKDSITPLLEITDTDPWTAETLKDIEKELINIEIYTSPNL